MKKLILLFVLFASLQGCDVLRQLEVPEQHRLSTTDIIAGLKQALETGTSKSVSFLGRTDGFYGSSEFRIPFPEDVQIVEQRLRGMGLDQIVDDFIRNMNRGAEQAVQLAGPIFLSAIREMTFEDAKSILQGPDNAATEYFRIKTSARLSAAFKPEVQKTLDKMEVTKHWADITSTYNRIPLVRKVETDLAKYVNDQTINALFSQLAKEERLIRTDPAARVTDLLKKVFGQQ
jgi:hypothetical protein